MTFIQQWLFELTQVWHPYYLGFAGLSCILLVILRRSSRGILRFTALTLFLFFFMLVSEALLLSINVYSLANIFHYTGLLALGVQIGRASCRERVSLAEA